MNIVELKNKKINELTKMAKDLNIEGAAGMRKQELIFSLLQAQIEKNGLIYGEGTLEILAGRIRFSARPQLQLSARTGRYLCLTIADPTVQPENGRHGFRTDPPAQGVRALFCTA
jgi:transcription termination factor Rho